jgi:hypothetical protein
LDPLVLDTTTLVLDFVQSTWQHRRMARIEASSRSDPSNGSEEATTLSVGVATENAAQESGWLVLVPVWLHDGSDTVYNTCTYVSR